jgi:uncharacterized protein (TIGR00725 family)
MGSGNEPHEERSSQVGQLLARLDVHLLTGGGQGVMLAVSRAFAETTGRKGLIIGVLPCREDDPSCQPRTGYPNPYVEVAIKTHLPLSGPRGVEALSRNHVNVLSSDAIVALPGGLGTSSETRLALRYNRPIIAFLPDRSGIPHLDPSIPLARTIEQVEQFLRACLQSHAGT